MKPLLVASTEERSGKTVVALALALAARERGETVGYGKPKGGFRRSVADGPADGDPSLAVDLLDLDADRHDLVPVVYSPGFIREVLRGRERPDPLRDRIVERVEAIHSGTDRVVLEGGTTLTAGGVADLSDPEVASVVDADVILVAQYDDPGDVDDVLAAADLLGDRLTGVLFNAVSDAAFDELASDVVPSLDERGIRVFGTLPRIPELTEVGVDRLVSEFDATVITDEAPTDKFVDRYVVGATGPSAAVERFRRTRDAVVVTGGDRTEIQTIGIDAEGVACLLLTGGIRPPDAVVGRANEIGVPLLLVDADATTVVERICGILDAGPAPSAAAVERVRTLIDDYADLDAMLPVEE